MSNASLEKQNLSAAATRRTLTRALVVAGLMVAGYVGCMALERSLHLTFDKPPMPLSKPLTDLSRRFGSYSADEPDEVMDDETIEVLGTKDYLLRTYTDNAKKADEVGAKLALNLNYYSTGNASPHVPEICWAGNGMNEAPNISRREFEVPNVVRKDGSAITLRMRMISFLPKREVGGLASETVDETKLLNVAYVFEVNGQYVCKPQDVSSLFWVASNKHAYHTKIEVTVPGYSTQDEAIGVVGNYMRAALPEIEQCLPAREEAGTSGAASTVGRGAETILERFAWSGMPDGAPAPLGVAHTRLGMARGPFGMAEAVGFELFR